MQKKKSKRKKWGQKKGKIIKISGEEIERSQ
jgi:hypothetical protein